MDFSRGNWPTVAHVMRIYLRRTETFVGNQFSTLRRFKPLVLCYRRQPELTYPIQDVAVESEMLAGMWKRIDQLAYRLCRQTFPRCVSVLADYALAHKTELLHYHFLVDARFLLEIKRKTKLPAIVSAYGYDVSSFPKRMAGMGLWYLRPLFTTMDYFLAMSRDMRSDLVALGCPREKVIVHYYGTDTSRFAFPERRYEEREVATILVCGSLNVKKAQHLVLQALRLVEHNRMSQHRFRVVFVGDGPMRSALERQVAEYGWQARVSFAGHVPHEDERLVNTYRQADIFALPSITTPTGAKEGIPGTIVEAMASGLPVVSTFHAGIPEIVQSGQEGILVTERDVSALARAFADLLDDPSLRQKLGEQAARRATTTLDLQQGTAELESIYEHVLSGDTGSLGSLHERAAHTQG
jgi:colanic acid/amylovoran biosynthesis glycosyltransferase